MFVNYKLSFVKMRKLKKVATILALLCLCITGTAKTYFVAPTGGSDTNPGTKDRPWATWQKAFNSAIAGDTVYFRGEYGIPHRKQYRVILLRL